MKPRLNYLFASLLFLMVWTGPAAAEPAGTVKFAFVSNPAFYIRHVVLEPLVIADRGRIKPMLAQSWQWKDDRTLEVQLRSKVRFHDGSAFDAAAVKANFDFFKKEVYPKALRDYFKTTRCDILGTHKVRFVLPQADALFMFQLSKVFQIAPARLRQLSGQKYGWGTFPMSADWGTGPFRLSEGFVVNANWSEALILDAFKDYWDPAFPKIRQVLLYDLASHFGWPIDKTFEIASRTVMESEGVIDIVQATQLQTLIIARSQYAKIEKIGRSMTLGLINMRKPDSIWRDVRLRRAANLALNRPFLYEMMKGNVDIGGGLIPPGHLGHNAELQPYPFAPDQAKTLVRAAGFEEDVKIKILLPYMIQKTIPMLDGMFKAAGFAPNFEPLEIDQLVKKFQLINLDQPAAQQGWDICIIKHFDVTYHPYFDIYQRYFDEDGILRWIDRDEELQSLIERIRQEPDEDRQDILLRQCEALVQQKAYVLNLYSLPNTYAFNKSVTALPDLSDERFFLREIELAPNHWSLRP